MSAPAVTVAALVEHQGQFLLVEEHINGRLVFNQPAGHVEPGETLLEAVVLETREETAWRLTPEAFLGAYLWRHPTSGRSSLRFAFIGTVDDHRPGQPLDHGIVRAHWLDPESLAALGSRLRSPLVLRCVRDYLSGRRLPLAEVSGLYIDRARDVEAILVESGPQDLRSKAP